MHVRSKNLPLLKPLAAGLLLLGVGVASAATGKLLLTGGVSSVDGAAGGGITPWAMIGSNATEGEVGVSAYLSRARTRDYGLTGGGLAVGLQDRYELSLARQDFDASAAIALNAIAPFGIRPAQHIRMDVLGAKVRVAGDAVLDSDRWMPQIALGVLHKRVHPGSLGSVLRFLGADTQATELVASASKLFLAQSLLVNGTLRWSNANQNGLLGFGSGAPGRDRRSLHSEWSVAWLLANNLAVGAEIRFKPDNLHALGAAAGLGDALREQRWRDLFIAWAPGKNLSFTLAWVDLGQILPGVTGNRRQTGYYLSGQAAF